MDQAVAIDEVKKFIAQQDLNADVYKRQVNECEPQAKHEFSGIDTMFLSEHERYAKCEFRNMVY